MKSLIGQVAQRPAADQEAADCILGFTMQAERTRDPDTLKVRNVEILGAMQSVQRHSDYIHICFAKYVADAATELASKAPDDKWGKYFAEQALTNFSPMLEWIEVVRSKGHPEEPAR